MRILKENYFLHLLLALVLCATLVSQTWAKPMVVFTGGETTVTLSDDLIGALGVLGLTAGALEPGTLSEEGVASFPIVSGALDLQTFIGEIAHTGGLSLSIEDGTTTVDLFDFTIDNATADTKLVALTGLAAVNNDLGGRFPLFKLDFTNAIIEQNDEIGTITISGVDLTLTAVGASALNAAFGVDALTEGFLVASADVTDAAFDTEDLADDTADGLLDTAI